MTSPLRGLSAAASLVHNGAGPQTPLRAVSLAIASPTAVEGNAGHACAGFLERRVPTNPPVLRVTPHTVPRVIGVHGEPRKREVEWFPYIYFLGFRGGRAGVFGVSPVCAWWRERPVHACPALPSTAVGEAIARHPARKGVCGPAPL